jgi:predicted CoA-binding protein
MGVFGASGESGIASILSSVKTIAVLGIKPETHADQPAYYVPRYMQTAGYRIIPVPVYFPEVREILGERIYRALADIPIRVDMVSIFRRPADIPAHIDDILAAMPAVVWMQSGIREEGCAARLRARGIAVVQDKCLMVEHRRS